MLTKPTAQQEELGVDFVYSFKNLDKANELLSNTKCQLNEMNECVFEISELSGDYNQKPVRVEEQNIIHLQKPVILAMKSILSTRLSALML